MSSIKIEITRIKLLLNKYEVSYSMAKLSHHPQSIAGS